MPEPAPTGPYTSADASLASRYALGNCSYQYQPVPSLTELGPAPAVPSPTILCVQGVILDELEKYVVRELGQTGLAGCRT